MGTRTKHTARRLRHVAAIVAVTTVGVVGTFSVAAAKDSQSSDDTGLWWSMTSWDAWGSDDESSSTFDGRTTLAEVVEQIGADDMWAAGHTGAGIDVAVIDTGIAPVTELSTTDVFVGPDLSFEGRVDAVAGLDTYGHGTHMAGIIAGRTPGADPLNPRPGDFIGVAPDARIVAVKVADHTGAVDVSQVIAAIDWVVQHRHTGGLNMGVLNLSYNTTSTQDHVDDPLSKAIENAWDHASSSSPPPATKASERTDSPTRRPTLACSRCRAPI